MLGRGIVHFQRPDSRLLFSLALKPVTVISDILTNQRARHQVSQSDSSIGRVIFTHMGNSITIGGRVTNGENQELPLSIVAQV